MTDIRSAPNVRPDSDTIRCSCRWSHCDLNYTDVISPDNERLVEHLFGTKQPIDSLPRSSDKPRLRWLCHGSSPYGSSRCDPGPQPQATESAPNGASSLPMALRHTAHHDVTRGPNPRPPSPPLTARPPNRVRRIRPASMWLPLVRDGSPSAGPAPPTFSPPSAGPLR